MGCTHRAANNFDALASGYRVLERILAGPLLQKVRCTYLHKLPDQGRILLLGDGPGRFLEELLIRKPELKVDYVEKSSPMIEQAQEALRKKQPSRRNVSWINGDILLQHIPEYYDAVVCHFFLDCFQELEIEKIVKKASAAMNPGACWITSDFQLPRQGWPRIRSQINLWLMYRFFRFVTNLSSRKLHDPSEILVRAGLILEDAKSWNYKLLKSECWRLPVPSE